MRAASAANIAVPKMARFFSLFFILQQLQVLFLYFQRGPDVGKGEAARLYGGAALLRYNGQAIQDWLRL